MKRLNTILQEIATKLDLATNKQEAINKGQDKYLCLEYNSNYGGYRLVNVNSGGHYGAFNKSSSCDRIPLKQMINYLEGILGGLESCTNKN